MKLQLWSWNYAPEPTAMGPIAALWAERMTARGHEVQVLAAHPHYPPEGWPQRFRPYRQNINGVDVLRLPLWIGHGSTLQRVREEITYALALAAAAPFASNPDVVVAVSPSFLALAPTMANARLRQRPWVLWLQDIIPDAAATTGLVRSPLALRLARSLERAAYRSASRIVVISDTFAANVQAKGVPAERIARVYNPATIPLRELADGPSEVPPRVLCIGNIGYSQGLVDVVRAFQTSDASRRARLVITGHGELADAVKAAIHSDSVEFLGLVNNVRLASELRRASLGLVSQRSDIEEFNVPSKLMNLMGQGLSVVANVSPRSETARIVSASGGGWIADSSQPEQLAAVLAEALASPKELRRRAASALAYARNEFEPDGFAEQFEALLESLAARAH